MSAQKLAINTALSDRCAITRRTTMIPSFQRWFNTQRIQRKVPGFGGVLSRLRWLTPLRVTQHVLIVSSQIIQRHSLRDGALRGLHGLFKFKSLRPLLVRGGLGCPVVHTEGCGTTPSLSKPLILRPPCVAKSHPHATYIYLPSLHSPISKRLFNLEGNTVPRSQFVSDQIMPQTRMKPLGGQYVFP